MSGIEVLALPEPLLLQPVEPDPAERLVQRPVELQHGRREDADHDRCVHRRQEDGGAEEPPAGHAAVNREGHDQRQDELDRDRDRENGVVLQRVEEDRVAPEQLEVVEADPFGRADPVPAREGVKQDAAERIGDEHADERNRGRSVEEAPQPLRAMGPPPNDGCRRRDQGFSDLRPLSTFCIALSGVVLPENAACSCW